ncbi:unnamed protein product [Merluccius merluccius]
MFWFQQGMCFLPASLVIWSSSNFIISYIIAIYRNDVDVIFPYISDTGAQPPESCIFGFMTSVTAFLALVTMYVRYKFVQRLNEDLRRVHHTLNACAFGLGMISCVGMCVVATFQETTLTVVHDTGALLFFGTGMFYAILQSAISYKINLYRSSLCMCHTRTAIATITLLAVLVSIVCGTYVKRTKLHRKPTDQDYTFHLVSAVGEWIVAFSFVSFFLTFIPDFKLFALQVKAELVQYS